MSTIAPNEVLPIEKLSTRRRYQSADIMIESSTKIGGLHLSDISSAQDRAYLENNKITCILTVTQCDAMIVPSDLIQHHKIIPAEDDPSFKLNQFFIECFQFIHDHRNKGRNVLVHCSAGVSRSATIVIGYLMTIIPELTFESALMNARKKRRIIRPNDGFLDQLRGYAKQIEEKRTRREELL